jgi:RNA recognition motif-containing protein
VGQLNPDLATEALLHDHFQDYGNIKNIHLVKRNKMGAGRPTAFAFIEFDSEHAARRAIDHEVNTFDCLFSIVASGLV